MLNLGKNIQSTNDPLTRTTAEQMYEMITHPSADLISKIDQLRTIMAIDPKKYNRLKRMLPYVVCAMFNPPYRRLENFASIDCFIIDIDHLADKNINMETLRKKLQEDPRVQLLFTSPGNNGLKALFQLQEKCFDKQRYSIFYKVFLHQFSNEYNLEQVVDKTTSDATRACFLSIDEKAWLNVDALPVDMKDFINFENYLDVEEAQNLIKKVEVKPEPETKDKELTPDLLAEIRKKLNPNARTKKDKNYYVPREVENVLEDVKKETEKFDIKLAETHPIQYGRKLKFVLQDKWAQMNIFYGKKGYKIVKTPVNNSDSELADVVYQILCEYFFGTDESSKDDLLQ
ncbi:MAG: CRISPR-associated primase-polymerase type B [Bacteroidota bacterium]